MPSTVAPAARAALPTTTTTGEEFFLMIEQMVNSRGEKPLEQFVEAHFDPSYVRRVGRAELLKQLEQIRQSCGNAGAIGILPSESDKHVNMMFETASGRWTLKMRLVEAGGQRLEAITLVQGVKPPALAPFTWETVDERMKGYESAGFAGSVLLVRDGKLVLRQGYGFADEARGIRNRTDTLFAIGSTPIDFTHAGILLLQEAGALNTSDRLSKYIEGVPEDKAEITLAQLMTGRSGLRNFHGIRGVDEDLDLSYIDRAEALRRILASPLLFAPGQGVEHSHSAWGVMAAVIEVVSEQSYGEFLEENLFKPAGMRRTGLYPHAMKFEDKDIAVGQAPPALGKPNSPKNWGPTSWLVMGSGGMVSTGEDLLLWLNALHAGKLLSPESLMVFLSGAVLSGGNDRGFMTVYTEGPDNLMILCSNSSFGMDDDTEKIGMGLAKLVRGGVSGR